MSLMSNLIEAVQDSARLGKTRPVEGPQNRFIQNCQQLFDHTLADLRSVRKTESVSIFDKYRVASFIGHRLVLRCECGTNVGACFDPTA